VTTGNGKKRLSYTHLLKAGVLSQKRYGLTLARASALPDPVVDRAEALADQYSESVARVAEPEAEDAQRANYVKLFCRLRLLAENEETTSDDDFRRHLKELRSKFIEE